MANTNDQWVLRINLGYQGELTQLNARYRYSATLLMGSGKTVSGLGSVW